FSGCYSVLWRVDGSRGRRLPMAQHRVLPDKGLRAGIRIRLDTVYAAPLQVRPADDHRLEILAAGRDPGCNLHPDGVYVVSEVEVGDGEGVIHHLRDNRCP